MNKKIGPYEVYPDSKTYLDKYLLSEEAYVSHWQPIKNKIFDNKVHWLPGRIFLPEFKLMSFAGGGTFAEKDFLLLQSCMRELGEQYFVVMQNYEYACTLSTLEPELGIPVLGIKLRYPIDVTWKELYTGDELTTELIDGFGGDECYVFGESGLWGKYAANDYVDWGKNPPGGPLDILGFKASCAELFQTTFHNCLTKSQKRTTREFLSVPSLHPSYKEYKEHLY
jgi:hypothetical protein